jgi:uncharacterized protein YrrD
MRVGKELIGKPIYSVSDGRQLGAVKDLYVDLELGVLNGIFLGTEGLFSKKTRAIPRESIVVFGIDAVLVKDSDVIVDSNAQPEVEIWMRRDALNGRDVDTPGGTKVGAVGDVLIDEEAKIVGFTLSRAHVTGPVAESKMVLKEAILDDGGIDGVMTIDLSKAERPPDEIEPLPESSPPPPEPAEEQPVDEGDE